MRKILAGLAGVLLLTTLFIGCSEPIFDEPLIFCGDYSSETVDITCKVISTSESSHEEMRYSPIGWNSTITIVDYSMVVEDANGKQLCLEITNGLYNLYKEGDTIVIQQEIRTYVDGKYGRDRWTKTYLFYDTTELKVLAIKNSSEWNIKEKFFWNHKIWNTLEEATDNKAKGN